VSAPGPDLAAPGTALAAPGRPSYQRVAGARRSVPALTEQQVVEAALRIVRADGIDALTMRRLSRELNVSPMAPYYYVESKEALLDLMAARALADIRLPARTDLPWDARLRMLIDRVDSELRHYRGVRDVLLARMHSTQRHVMRGMMELLQEAGFDDASIVMAYAMVHTYLFGRYRVSMPAASEAADWRPGDDILARIQPVVAGLHGHDYYEFGIDTIIAGLRTRLRTDRGARENRKEELS
jgi:TetR/AcrR family tetracycline transcriptional repressor